MNVPTSNHALPTRERSNKRGLDPTCCLCGEATELSQHCMWSCVHAQEIWKQSLHILARIGGYGEVSWVVTQWLIHQESWFPWFNESGPFMQLEWGTIRTTDSPSWPQKKSIELKSLWLILVGLTTWHIWKHRCRMIFQARPILPVGVEQGRQCERYHIIICVEEGPAYERGKNIIRTERERERHKEYNYIQECNSYNHQNDNNLYKRLQGHFI